MKNTMLIGSFILVLGMTAVMVAYQQMKKSQRWNKALPAIEAAEHESSKQVALSLQRLNSFFNDAKRRTPVFIDDVLGFKTKYTWATGSEEDVKKHIRELWNKDVFTPEQARDAVLRTIKDYQDEVEAVENRMLVRIDADLKDLPAPEQPRFSTDESARKSLDSAIMDASKSIAPAVRNDVASCIASHVAGNVAEAALAGALSRLTVSGVLIGGSSSLSLESFGISIVIGLALDWVIGKVWDWAVDPKGKIDAQLQGRIEAVRSALIDGDGKNPGLRQILDDACKKRKEIRRQALEKMLQ